MWFGGFFFFFKIWTVFLFNNQRHVSECGFSLQILTPAIQLQVSREDTSATLLGPLRSIANTLGDLLGCKPGALQGLQPQCPRHSEISFLNSKTFFILKHLNWSVWRIPAGPKEHSWRIADFPSHSWEDRGQREARMPWGSRWDAQEHKGLPLPLVITRVYQKHVTLF